MISKEEFDKKKAKEISHITVCLAQPRSGSTLLMRLVGMACHDRVRGDMNPKIIESWCNLYWSLKEDKGQKGGLIKFEQERIFPDQYREDAAWRNNQGFNNYALKNALIGGTSGFIKLNNIGFGNDLVRPFVDTLRDMADYDKINLQIVFLFRDHNDIEKSLMDKWKQTGMTPDIPDLSNHIQESLEWQRDQFNDCFELGDKKIKYDDIVNDTKNVLIKMNPKQYPNDEIMSRILSNKIK